MTIQNGPIDFTPFGQGDEWMDHTVEKCPTCGQLGLLSIEQAGKVNIFYHKISLGKGIGAREKCTIHLSSPPSLHPFSLTPKRTS
ncbi:MAG: hypothetical protein HOC74_15125 [Gemmatimonadetes bacterium]|jgi:hypothetical protein|nr:hypothetical protein [Gemmatimonadota bacterium]